MGRNGHREGKEQRKKPSSKPKVTQHVPAERHREFFDAQFAGEAKLPTPDELGTGIVGGESGEGNE